MMKSKQRVIFSLFILSLCYSITMAEDSPCGDWEPYKDEKCFKIIDETLQTYDYAEKVCSQQENSAALVIIHSKEEQDFLSKLLFKTHKVVDNVWIGVRYNSNKFKWIDNSDLSFTNWVEGSPKNKIDYGCVQMQSEETSVGKWTDEPCNKKNLVVCQKMQTWTISRLQKTLLDARKELTDSLNDIKKQFTDSLTEEKNNVRKELDNLKQNPVPVGFIYVQLPNQPVPKTLWSMVEWKDVTSDYAGLFFRAQGGRSAAFEATQEEDSPRLISVKHSWNNAGCGDPTSADNACQISPGHWSPWAGSGGQGPGWTTMSFLVSSGEVRPRNKAIRIWKRTH